METPEIGSLTAHSPQESQFVGSSSGVFFINTVRQAFFSSSGEFPPPEDTLVGNESTPRTKTQEETPVSQWEYDDSMACVLGQAPPQQLARDLMMVFFKVWHPLFPFLHGPTFLHAMESLYAEQAQNQTHQPSKNKHNSTAWAAIFQCIFHLANLVRPDIELPVECRIQPPISASIHTLLSPLTARHDLLSLQALLASQLYLVATMSLRTASTVGGCMLRSMLHAGLHRCPFRYHELSTSSQQRHLRKRIFWSAYALDRYLSQALGLPLGVQDSDIDVCPPGSPEIHKPLQHLPTPNNRAPPPSQAESEQSKREIPFASYVQSGKLTGEALELFHKSIFVRSISQTSVLVLTTSVHKWWNSLDLPPSPPPQQPPTPSDSLIQTPTIDSTPFNYTPFFTILYQHLLLLLHRPSLSLPNSTPEFASALQSCISAARHILLALKAQTDSNQALFWPGFLSAAWMAGLVLAFACQLGQYGRAKGCLEISSCLDFLRIMSAQWEPAKHCHRALSLLLRAVSRLDIDSNSTAAATSTTTTATTNVNLITRTCISRLDPPSPGGEGRESESPLNTRKRRKLGPSSPRFESARSPAVDFASAEDSVAGVSRVAEGVSDGLLSIGEVGSGFNTQHDRNWDLSLDLDMNMVDLLQEGNFDSLMDLFGQQYPTF
ncbi:transcription factor domain-containing protein [Aspergillus lucknowensis]|uniref:Fungal-specific transcription factor domain-containing protein n=1 Tax=Aspergillus lucknowensis TaxID=176173 RepID=A0ABR4M373_9EURO